MISDNFSLLELLLSDQDKQTDLYQPSAYWNGYSKRIAKAIKKNGLHDFRSNVNISKGFADCVNLVPFECETHYNYKDFILKFVTEIPWLKRHWFGRYNAYINTHAELASKFRDCCYEHQAGELFNRFFSANGDINSTIGNPGNIINIAGKTLGERYFQSILRVINTSKNVDYHKHRAFAEIGGGFGAMTHTLLSYFPNIKKAIYMDIPPNLYIGSQYLKSIYGDKVIDYSVTRNHESIMFKDNDELEILSIAPWQFKKVASEISLFWNCSSFQEMTPDIIANYTSILSSILSKNVLTDICLYFYGDPCTANTLSHQKVLNIVSENTGKTLKIIDPIFETMDCAYYIG